MKEIEDTCEDDCPLTEEELGELAKLSPKAKYLKHWRWVFLAFIALLLDYQNDGLIMQLLRGFSAAKD